MNEKESGRSFGELPTLGHEETRRAEPRSAAEGPSWSTRELSEAETLKAPAEGIRDDGRTDAARRWKPGDVILDRYVVEGELGQGGMGVVYACLDRVGGVRVAVKCLPPELSHNSVEMEEVRENFRLVCGLAHPNIAVVRHLERDGRGEYFLVMDIAEGESLRKWMRAKLKSGGVGLAEAAGILRQVASALDYAHGKKVIHRDIKPGNVVIDARTGEVKVLDFGLAAQIRTSLSRASQAYRGTSGTGPYMAPEQWRAQPQDAKTDQYALGVMAYEMLAGRLPFENPELAVLKDAVLNGNPPEIAGVPPRAMAAIRRAMAKRAEERFGSCTEFVEALAGKKRLAGDGSPRRAFGGWMAALVLAAGVAGAWWWGGGRENASGPPVQRQESAARPEGSPHQTAEEAEAEKSAEEELQAAEKAEENKRLAEQKAAEEEARRLEDERVAEEKAAKEKRLAGQKEAEAEAKRLEEERARAQREEKIRQKKEWEPSILLKATVNGGEVEAMVTKGVSQGGVKTPVKLDLKKGRRYEFALEYEAGGKKYTGRKMVLAKNSGRMEAVVPLDYAMDLGGGVQMVMVHCPGVAPDFWMGKYEVTQDQWQRVTHTNPAVFTGKPKNPVEHVSWNDCQEFLRKLNALPAVQAGGLTFRLPEQDEWMTACLAGAPESADYCRLEDGTQITAQTLGMAARYGSKEWEEGPVAVGSSLANAWGLHDMHGNVWEWTQTANGAKRVLLGGSFCNTAGECRAGYQCWDYPDYVSGNLGLRLAASGRAATR